MIEPTMRFDYNLNQTPSINFIDLILNWQDNDVYDHKNKKNLIEKISMD